MKFFVVITITVVLNFGLLTKEINAFKLKLDAQAAGEDFVANSQYSDFHPNNEKVEHVLEEKQPISNPFMKKEKLPSLDDRCIHPYGFCSFIHF